MFIFIFILSESVRCHCHSYSHYYCCCLSNHLFFFTNFSPSPSPSPSLFLSAIKSQLFPHIRSSLPLQALTAGKYLNVVRGCVGELERNKSGLNSGRSKGKKYISTICFMFYSLCSRLHTATIGSFFYCTLIDCFAGCHICLF